MRPFLLITTLVVLAFMSAVVIVLQRTLPLTESVRIAFGIPYILFLPGFIWTFVLFRTNDKEHGIDWVERCAVSLALSLFVVPIVIFLLNRFGVPITTSSIIVETLVLILAGIIVLLMKNAKRRGSQHANG